MKIESRDLGQISVTVGYQAYLTQPALPRKCCLKVG
jgi:hypothetical protein